MLSEKPVGSSADVCPREDILAWGGGGVWGQGPQGQMAPAQPRGACPVPSLLSRLVSDGLPEVTFLKDKPAAWRARAPGRWGQRGVNLQAACCGQPLAVCDRDETPSLLGLGLLPCGTGTGRRWAGPESPWPTPQLPVGVRLGGRPRQGLRCPDLHAPLRRPPGQTTRLCTGTCCGPAACTGSRRSRPPPWSATR